MHLQFPHVTFFQTLIIKIIWKHYVFKFMFTFSTSFFSFAIFLICAGWLCGNHSFIFLVNEVRKSLKWSVSHARTNKRVFISSSLSNKGISCNLFCLWHTEPVVQATEVLSSTALAVPFTSLTPGYSNTRDTENYWHCTAFSDLFANKVNRFWQKKGRKACVCFW